MDDKTVALALFLIVVTSLYLHSKGTIDDFELAKKIMEGETQPLHVAFAASISQIIFQQTSTPDVINLLLVISPLLFATSAVMIFFAARKLGLSVHSAAFGALLYAFSLVSLQFLPGTYSAVGLASPLFAAFILFSMLSEPLFYANVLAAAAVVVVEPAFSIPGFLFSVAWGLQRKKMAFALPAVLFAFEALQAGFSVNSEGFGFVAFLAAAALVLFNNWYLLVAGALSALFLPVASAQMLALQAAYSFERPKHDRRQGLISSFLVGFVFFAGLFLFFGAEIRTILVGSLLLALIFPILLHTYEYRQDRYFLVLCLGLLVASIFAFAAYPLSGGKYYPQFADPELVKALSYLSAYKPEAVMILGNQKAAEFFLPNTTIIKSEKARAYLEGKENLKKAFLVLSLSDLDAGAFEPEYTSYKFVKTLQTPYGEVAVFSSRDGKVVVRRLDQSMQLAVADGELFDARGRFYDYVPLSRMQFLRNLSFDSERNRMIVFAEDAGYPRFLDIYSERTPIAEFGDTAIFEVGEDA